MKSIFNLLVLCTLIGAYCAEKVRYDNYGVFRLTVDNESQLEMLQRMDVNDKGYIFSEPPMQPQGDVDLLVAPHKLSDFTQTMELLSIKHTLVNPNFQDLLDAESSTIQPKAMDWTNYHSLEEIYAWLDELVAEFPNVVTLVEIGQSYEGRTMRVLKMSHRAGNQAIFVEANIHAREWISSATATWTINELLRSTDPAIRNIADNYDWYFIPVSNPDGYEFSRVEDRMWRKTRSPQADDCIGVDPNRNFGFKWMEGGASSNPCSLTFAGPSPWSEIEVRNIADYYITIASNVVVYLSFHSYGQYLLFPFGTSVEPVENYDDLMTIGNAAGDVLRQRFGTVYRVGNSQEVLYATSGISVDWAYGAAKTPIGYTYEFRDNGPFGFVLPPHLIINNALETMDSLVALINKTKELGYFN